MADRRKSLISADRGLHLRASSLNQEPHALNMLDRATGVNVHRRAFFHHPSVPSKFADGFVANFYREGALERGAKATGGNGMVHPLRAWSYA